MHSKQDGFEIPPYAAETAREISKAGPGGHGNMESMADAQARGVTPQLVAQAAARAAKADSAGPSEGGRDMGPGQIPADQRK